MGTNSWQQKIDINKQLFEQSSKFSFVQAIRLLELGSKNKKDDLETKIRVHPRLSLDFPNSDIVDIKQKDDIVKLTVTFMGLYGESSPLPTFYTESLLDEELEDESVMRDFIDIFNIPIYQAYFEVWLKNRLGVRLNEFNDPKVLELLHVFSGMPKEHLREKHKDSYSLLKYAGLNMQYPRSAEALRILVSDIIEWESIEIIQCVEQMASIPQSQYCSLGNINSRLDDDLHLGDKIKDRMGKFRISITDLDMENYILLLPDGEKYKSLVKAVDLYLTEPLDWDIQLTLKEDVYQSISLGGTKDSKLGLNTWLGNRDEQSKVRTLFLDNNQYKGGLNGSK
jgi:type VI secretion system protein ImpH